MNTPNRRHLLLQATLLAGLAPLGGSALAQSFPDKPITFVVPFTAGSATDQLARALANAISADSKHAVVVDNKPGANAFIGAQAVAKAKPDGYTVLIATNTTHAANEHLYKKLPYDPIKDFEPITALGRGGQLMVVGAQSPFHSVGDFVKAAKANPGKYSFGAGSSSSRIAGEMFKQLTGTYIVAIPYRSNPPAVTDLIGGQLDLMFTDMATGLPQVKGGKLRALGVTPRQRSPLAPEVPTIEEAGVKGYEATYWFAAYAPAGTPAPVVAKLNELLHKAARGSAGPAFYQPTGTEVYVNSPDELRKFQAAESLKWSRIIKAAGIEPE
ncbi:tripartite tricarboxylate transporter substrate binding protein [Curvibacter sp. RS43]|uniref:Tripartite tricarboxylate transporter substrate binding protein n=1 Tax=Curvibacter microcysteis TaxID=3026419 RepID=A0ABT5MAF6_9BURK|nr:MULTISPECIES: tripartite tricarboxylate transporter substrate binding protein [unclassified Curvibacter]MDD0811325.1 tripartite tricarboxylate transporter substrate binding protein [Curvibacter sp. RS43]MDD0813567.1 tripartite tricarboxylate transporter substrate binding protein [Curvibacter sp. HBC28]